MSEVGWGGCCDVVSQPFLLNLAISLYFKGGRLCVVSVLNYELNTTSGLHYQRDGERDGPKEQDYNVMREVGRRKGACD